jgi:5-hydroxyisourate hydrolase
MTAVTTHILDTVRGAPAAGVVVRLERVLLGDGAAGAAGVVAAGAQAAGAGDGTGGSGGEIGRRVTDGDGRIGDFGLARAAAGVYRLIFETGPYLSAAHAVGAGGGEPFFPEVVVTFAADGDRAHYHVPLLLSPYSYSTYRGS